MSQVKGKCPACGAKEKSLVLDDMGMEWVFQREGDEEIWKRFVLTRPAKCLKCGWKGMGKDCLTISKTKKNPSFSELLKALKNLTSAVKQCLDQIDIEMNNPSSPNRGSKIAMICNALEMQNDLVRYIVLRIDFRKDKNKRKEQ